MTTGSRRPDVVFILSDDQGAWALGSAGNHEIHTPVLDDLAARGVRFENMFCASPVCSPARASLLTGQIPSRHGVHDYLDGGHAGPDAVDLLAGRATFTDALADAGYRLGLSGKWHLGASDVPRRGFTHWFALAGGGSAYRGARMFREDGREEVVDDYLTDAIADDAVAFLESEADSPDPVFLAVHFTAPHKPFAGQHPEAFERLYDDCAFETCPQEEPHPWLVTLDGAAIGGEPDVRAALVGYFAAVSAMDAAIGRVLAAVPDDAIVVFASDNGFSCGQHGFWGKGNGTFPLNMYDSSVKVPTIIRGPGIEQGGVREELVSAYDMAATLMELVGLDPAPFETGPGRSFASLLPARGDDDDTRSGGDDAAGHVVVHDEYGPARMIRSQRWKYVHRHPFGPHELYDMVADPGERVNLVEREEHAPRVAELRARLHDWFRRHGDPDADGAALPVFGAGQRGPLADDPLAAFVPPEWEGRDATGQSMR